MGDAASDAAAEDSDEEKEMDEPNEDAEIEAKYGMDDYGAQTSCKKYY